MKTWLVGVVVVLVVAGCSGASPTPQIVYVTPAPTATPGATLVAATSAPSASAGHTLTGEVTLNVPSSDWLYVDPANPAAGCKGKGGYSDFGPGANVVVKDGAGTVIGSAQTTPEAASISAGCGIRFSVDVPDVPFYSVEIGHRGALTYANADLVAKNWHVALTLGG